MDHLRDNSRVSSRQQRSKGDGVTLVKHERAELLMNAVLEQLTPLFPPGVRVTVGQVRVGVTLESDRRQGGSTIHWTAGIGAWIPFLPRRFNAKLAASAAVETVLDLAFRWEHTSPDYHVRATIRDDGIQVGFDRPAAADSAERITLDPLPFNLF